jgi:hypothetical protein
MIVRSFRRSVLCVGLAAAAWLAVATLAVADSTTRQCGSLTVHAIACGQARTIMRAWQDSYALPHRFRYGKTWWSCSLGNAHGGKQLASCVSGKKWFRSVWPADWNSGQGPNGCQPKPVLLDYFDGSGDGYALDLRLSIVDLEATKGIGCRFANRFSAYSYSHDHLRGSNGTNRYGYGGYTWRCTTDGVAGNPSVHNWSDISVDCTSLPTKQTTLPQWLDLDVSALPGVSCSSKTFGPALDESSTADSNCPYRGYAWNDSGSGGKGARVAGLRLATYSDCSRQTPECSWGTMDVPIPGAEDHFGLCIWKYLGLVPRSPSGYGEYTCSYGQK